eukprot:COSAG01_NODE_2010_length_8657_cov_6.034237_4_plen_51_part_00
MACWRSGGQLGAGCRLEISGDSGQHSHKLRINTLNMILSPNRVPMNWPSL